MLVKPRFALRSRRHRLSQSSRAAGGPGAAQGAAPAAAASSGAAAAGPGGDRRLQLATYLPAKVVAAFREAGLTSDLYEWQVPVLAVILPHCSEPPPSGQPLNGLFACCPQSAWRKHRL